MADLLPPAPPVKSSNNYGVIVSIVIGAWIIGASILLAGWWIAQRVNPSSQVASTPLTDVKVPDSAAVLGSRDARVTIIEYADYQCPFCGQWEKSVYPQLKAAYLDTGKAKFIYQDYAFLGEESILASEAAKCAGDQGKYWEYHDILFANQKGENQGAFVAANLVKFANQIGLNEADFKACTDSRKHKTDVELETQQGIGYGVQATPTIFINGQKFEGVLPWTAYQAAIESALK
jgi:protein-disulfide isomerase